MKLVICPQCAGEGGNREEGTACPLCTGHGHVPVVIALAHQADPEWIDRVYPEVQDGPLDGWFDPDNAPTADGRPDENHPLNDPNSDAWCDVDDNLRYDDDLGCPICGAEPGAACTYFRERYGGCESATRVHMARVKLAEGLHYNEG